MNNPIADSITARIEAIRAAYRERGLKLEPPASLETLQAFEQRYNIRLPEEYRRFVLSVGNGGDGTPHYGLFRLEDADHDEMGQVAPGFAPSAPFPLVESWIWEDDPDPDETLHRHVHDHGHVYLGTDGCGLEYVLITAGAEQGHVWVLTGEGASPAEEDPVGFLDWLEQWLMQDRQDG